MSRSNPKGLNKPQDGVMRIMGVSANPLKYSSAGTRYASLHGFQQGAEFNEVNEQPTSCPGEIENDWCAMNIRSGANVTDCPSRYGSVKYGLRKVGPLVFTPEQDFGGWIRPKGEW